MLNEYYLDHGWALKQLPKEIGYMSSIELLLYMYVYVLYIHYMYYIIKMIIRKLSGKLNSWYM